MYQRLIDIFQQRLVRNILTYGCSVFLMKGISLIMLPLIAGHIAIDEMGKLQLLAGFSAILSIFVACGFEDAFFRYTSDVTTAVEKRLVTSRLFMTCLAIGILFAATFSFFILLVGKIDFQGVTSIHFLLVILTVSFEGVIAVPLAWLRAEDRAGLFFLSVMTRVSTHSGIIVYLIATGSSLDAQLILFIGLISASIQGLTLSLFMVSKVGVHVSIRESIRYIRYGIPLLASGVVMFSLYGADKLILGSLSALDDLAVYGIACKFSLALILLMQPFSIWWRPKRFTILNSQDKHKYARYIHVACIYLLACAMFVSIFAPLLIHTLMPTDYAGSILIVGGVVFAYLFKEAFELFNIGLLTGETSKGVLLVNLKTALAGVPLVYVGVYFYGVPGCVLALCVLYTSRFILAVRLSQKNIPLPYDWTRLVILYSSFCVFASAVLVYVNSFITYIPVLILAMALAVVLFIWTAYQILTRNTDGTIKGVNSLCVA